MKLIETALCFAGLLLVGACAQQPPRPSAMDEYNAFNDRRMAELKARSDVMQEEDRAHVRAMALRATSSNYSDAAFTDAGLAAVRGALKDPGSAQFRSIRIVRLSNGGQLLCGQVNAKNALGGYVGFVTFAASNDEAVLQPVGAGVSAAPHLGVTDACG